MVVETDPDQWTAQLQLEGREPSGKWKLLSAKPEASDAPPALNPRLDAARELRRRGAGDVLSFENETATLDLREHADLYGVREVARNQDARLYELPME